MYAGSLPCMNPPGELACVTFGYVSLRTTLTISSLESLASASGLLVSFELVVLVSRCLHRSEDSRPLRVIYRTLDCYSAS